MPQVWLYDEGTAPTLRCGEAAAYVADTLGARLPACGGQAPEVYPPGAGRSVPARSATARPAMARAGCRGDFITHWLTPASQSVAGLALSIARLKVRDPSMRPAQADPLPGEVAFEQRRLEQGDRGAFGILYDGFPFQALLAELLGGREPHDIHIVVTNRLLATWEDADLRYHLRTIICGAPCVVSTSGLVEAPARPREFYAARQALGTVAAGGADYEILKQQFAGRFLDHDDARLTEVVKGYALQAIAYHLSGEPFCEDPHCRLYNAHWQEEMLAAQIGGKLCDRHQALLRGARDSAV